MTPLGIVGAGLITVAAATNSFLDLGKEDGDKHPSTSNGAKGDMEGSPGRTTKDMRGNIDDVI